MKYTVYEYYVQRKEMDSISECFDRLKICEKNQKLAKYIAWRKYHELHRIINRMQFAVQTKDVESTRVLEDERDTLLHSIYTSDDDEITDCFYRIFIAQYKNQCSKSKEYEKIIESNSLLSELLRTKHDHSHYAFAGHHEYNFMKYEI